MEIGNKEQKINCVLDEINKKVEVKFFKEKKTSRTYIEGLEGFITDKEERDKIIKSLKKALGTNSLVKQVTPDGKPNEVKEMIGFNGKHVEAIINYLKNDLKIPSNKISCIL